MRIKTLAVVLIGAMALFTAFYWLTDAARRDATYKAQIQDLVAYGQQLFGPPTAANLNTANCARCHGPDGHGGVIPNLGGRRAPNLHSKSIYEKLKAQVRARVEHPFHIVKDIFKYKKTRYKGLAKNDAQLNMLFALSNLYMVISAIDISNSSVFTQALLNRMVPSPEKKAEARLMKIPTIFISIQP